jgi:hypothetical protein
MFRFTGLPPGRYYLAALTEVDQSNLSDEAFLKRVAASATIVTLAEGEKKVQELKLGSGAQPPQGGFMLDHRRDD